MSSKFLEDLSNDYEKLFKTEIGYDVIIYVGEEPDVKEIHAHSNIFCIRSQYFHKLFSNECTEKKDGKFVFRKPNISPTLFDIILRFIYCGNIELKNLQEDIDVLKLLVAADELNIQSLIFHTQEYLINHKAEFLNQNLTKIIETIFQHETLMDLWDFCLKKICKTPKILFKSDTFINLKAPLLELLLKQNDLNIEEIEIWENLLKWCFAQQNVMNDPAKWSEEDITKIEGSLNRFIPLIRFRAIKPTDFFYKVYPYKDVLTQDLIHNLLELHIVPNVKSETNLPPSRVSNLKFELDSASMALFASWIDKVPSDNYKKENIPYEFKLLYCSNKDGFDATSFHKNCNEKESTIWVAKIQGSAQFIGGYNPLDWNGNFGLKNIKNGFLFSFKNGQDNSTAKIGYVNKVYCNTDEGPSTGNLRCYDKNWNCKPPYPDLSIPESFVVEYYEVFQVIKNMITEASQADG